MLYALTFLEGILTFISPCLLPLLPIFVSYFAGVATDDDGSNPRKHRLRVLASALFFMAGFTSVFVLLGVFAGTLGAFITQYQTIVNIVAGSIVILFGLGYMGLFKLPDIRVFSRLADRSTGESSGRKDGIRSFFLGVIFSVSHTPCISAFLGSALLLAAASGTWYIGALLLLFYSLGLGIPFVISALLINSLKGAFDFIKRNYRTIRIASGGLLILMGILIMSGYAFALTGFLTNL
ncbi:MAG: cytochrome c biogenesis protein CcdA [Coriobacteriia bacterium]|nr:cytochrome c biogenesis protein CcdA [Coriobacteriia bacterium]